MSPAAFEPPALASSDETLPDTRPAVAVDSPGRHSDLFAAGVGRASTTDSMGLADAAAATRPRVALYTDVGLLTHRGCHGLYPTRAVALLFASETWK